MSSMDSLSSIPATLSSAPQSPGTQTALVGAAVTTMVVEREPLISGQSTVDGVEDWEGWEEAPVRVTLLRMTDTSLELFVQVGGCPDPITLTRAA